MIERLEPGVAIIINDRELIPNNDLTDLGKKRTKFNAKGKNLGLHPFGAE